MSLLKNLSPYFSKQDPRGFFLGITNQSWSEMNYIETESDEVRGNHYHQETEEMFFIVEGQIKIELQSIDQPEKKQTYIAKKHDIFIIPPRVLHTFYVEKKSSWINFLSKPMDPKNPDLHRWSAS